MSHMTYCRDKHGICYSFSKFSLPFQCKPDNVKFNCMVGFAN